jgi:ABC-2 type transport system permease protein
MTTAIHLTRSESRKLFLSRTYLGAFAISVGIALFSVFVDAAVAGKNGQPRLGTTSNTNHLLQVGAVTCIAMLVVGILSSGGEYRHRTIVSTMLVAPRRSGVVAAKAVSVFFAGVLLSAVTFALSLGAIYGILMANNFHHLPSDTLRIAVGSVAASTLFGLIGMALGFITRSTLAAVVAFVGWVVFGELAIMPALFPHVEKWLPAGLAQSLTYAPGAAATPAALAVAVLAGYVAILLVCAGAAVTRRDVI